MTIYRKIYEEKYGPIPKDENGRTYEIHHIDGNHNNNSIDNLACVSIQDHYDIHFKQRDYNACILILERMCLTPDEIAEKAREIALKQLEDGTHNFSKPDFQKRNAIRRVKNGTHHWLGKRNPSHKRVQEGTHNFQSPEKKKCEHCGKEVDPGNYALHHGEYCFEYTGLKSPSVVAMSAKAGKHVKDTIWINNGKINKRIKADEKIPEGFYKGKKGKKK